MIKVDNRPIDQEYAQLVECAYYKKDLKVGDNIKLNSDWRVHCYEERSQGYCGVIYVSKNTKQVVLVHQETSLPNYVINWSLYQRVGNRLGAQQEAAFSFLKVAIKVAQDLDFHLSFAGYFWGGFFS